MGKRLARRGRLAVTVSRFRRSLLNLSADLVCVLRVQGAVGDIIITDGRESGMEGTLAVTAGADCRVQVLEARKNWSPVQTYSDHKDFIYSLAVSNGCE